MVLIDYCILTFHRHPIIPISFILFQLVSSLSHCMSTHSTPHLLHQPQTIPHPLMFTVGPPFHVSMFCLLHVVVST